MLAEELLEAAAKVRGVYAELVHIDPSPSDIQENLSWLAFMNSLLQAANYLQKSAELLEKHPPKHALPNRKYRREKW
jgi:hypothetical protein